MHTRLSEAQCAAFDRDGFLVVPSVLGAETLATLRHAMAQRVTDLLQRYQRLGRGRGAGSDFEENLTHLLHIAPEAYQHLDISLPMLHDYASRVAEWQEVFGEEWREQAGIHADASIFDLLTHRGIVGIATQLLGEEVEASPVQHVRIKPPQRLLSGSAAVDANTARTLWHQDEAVVTEEARGVDILTVWVAITEATEQNGCMQAVAGSHRAADDAALPDFGLTTHCPGKGELVGEIYIPEDAVAQSACTPLLAAAGDLVLLHKRTVHGARANTSNGVRWSFDLRYQPAGTPSGRSCFPSTLVHSCRTPQQVLQRAEDYRARWHAARDAILSGAVQAEFNSRWNKYAPVCA